MHHGYGTRFGSERPIGIMKWIQRVAGFVSAYCLSYFTLHVMSFNALLIWYGILFNTSRIYRNGMELNEAAQPCSSCTYSVR